ncbi:oligosaccharyl transferase, archaeosortase A system-associated [Natronolimnohabitans sp. A-GB9]|uniref:oligosaccharyl transferase, archaeosortase A system-associated n=1 Tax=Natronolimnohabitans sp. A-GB9 TaxID=3069757 RepID=UPI0027B7988B|nr:oligosaccharyl transferase, archaeosortase A system-associated [Natronolimnohabitans sp. A-GB9]MDQ2049457.1 oligosaccharyl transferase, archaeosortase A system-associated [Natronolimnohabitans sp. A-GB9]
MSTDTERLEEGTDTSSSFLGSFADWYHLPVIGVAMLFMFWIRIQAYDRFVTEDGTPALGGVDSWYHWRTVEWTAENYPYTMPYEIWTGFPTGNYVGQFGTLFDQIIVTIAMIVGLGDPSTSTLYTVALLTVPVMAALVAIPVFYIGRRLGGTIGGLVSVLLLAFAPGTFLYRTTAGQIQHHVAEVLFMAISILAMMVALRVAEREKPVYELLVDKDWDALRTPAIFSLLAGGALSLYLWVWPPGVVLIGIFAIFFAIQLCLDYVRGRSPDHVAFVGAVSMAVPTVFMLVMLERVTISSETSFGLLQPTAAALVALGALFMAWLARQWDDRSIDRRYYPVAIVGIIVAVFAVMWAALPDLYSTLIGNLTSRLLPLDPGTGAQTISEAQPPDNFTEHVYGEFGAAFYTMLAGLALLVTRPLRGREFRAEHTLIVVWSLFLISMAATQIRFAYYLVLAVAVVNAVFVADVVRLFDLDIRGGVDSLRQVETYQIIALVLVVMLLFAPLLPPMAADETAWDRGENVGPHSEAMVWEESNHWLAENTPEPGNWGEYDNAERLEYFGSYDLPEDENYDYPEGAYGVMSWWDYGHLITTQAERIPHSNPFQQNAHSSSAFLTAESEQRGELILDAIAAGESPEDATDEELEAMAAEATHEELRYVMIDHAMAGGKFPAITEWSGPDYGHYVTPPDHDPDQHIDAAELRADFEEAPYHDTMLSQLYSDDAEGMEQYRLVHETADVPQQLLVTHAQMYMDGLFPPESEEFEQAQQAGYTDGDVLHLDDDGQLVSPDEGDPAIVTQRMSQERFMEFEQSPTTEVLDAQVNAAVKTYERVDGATLTGEVEDDDALLEDDATVTVDVELETNAERTFTYTQEAELDGDGSFEVTVPYATDDELGVDDGYTDSAVEATGEYNVSVGEFGEDGYLAQTEVAEEDVVQGGQITVEDFEQVELEDPDADEDELPEDELPEDDEIVDNETDENDIVDNETMETETEGAAE